MKLERAKLDAELEILQHEKEAAAAEAQAVVLEAAAEQNGGVYSRTPPPLDIAQRTQGYVAEQASLHAMELLPPAPFVSGDLRRRGSSHAGPELHTNATGCLSTSQADQRPPPPIPAPPNSGVELAGVIRYLCRRDLVSTGLTTFDDQPDSYRAWKSSFKGVIRTSIYLLRKSLTCGLNGWVQIHQIRPKGLDRCMSTTLKLV